jgi:hypothetical protein
MLAWGEVTGIRDLENDDEVRSIAFGTNIPWLVDLQPIGGDISEQVVMKAIAAAGEHESLKRLVEMSGVRVTRLATLVMLKHFDLDLVRSLFTSTKVTNITAGILIAAASNVRNGDHVMRLLLQWPQESLKITGELMAAVAKNDICGKQIAESLFQTSALRMEPEALTVILPDLDLQMVKILLEVCENVTIPHDTLHRLPETKKFEK